MISVGQSMHGFVMVGIAEESPLDDGHTEFKSYNFALLKPESARVIAAQLVATADYIEERSK